MNIFLQKYHPLKLVSIIGIAVLLFLSTSVIAGAQQKCGPDEAIETGDTYQCTENEDACKKLGGTVYKEVGKTSCPLYAPGKGIGATPCCAIPKPKEGATSTNSSGTPGKTYTLANPIGTSDLTVIAGRVIKAFLGIVGALALLAFVYGGILYLTAGGSDRTTKAQNTIKYAALGIIIIMFSYTLTSIFINAWTSNPVPEAPVQGLRAPGEEDTQAQQEVTTLEEQNQAAAEQTAAQKKQAAEAAAEAKKKQNTCDTFRPGYSCKTSYSNGCYTSGVSGSLCAGSIYQNPSLGSPEVKVWCCP